MKNNHIKDFLEKKIIFTFYPDSKETKIVNTQFNLAEVDKYLLRNIIVRKNGYEFITQNFDKIVKLIKKYSKVYLQSKKAALKTDYWGPFNSMSLYNIKNNVADTIIKISIDRNENKGDLLNIINKKFSENLIKNKLTHFKSMVIDNPKDKEVSLKFLFYPIYKENNNNVHITYSFEICNVFDIYSLTIVDIFTK